jgi:hypothetical protein
MQRFDTKHGLDWDGPGPVPKVYGLEAAKPLPKRGIFRKGCSLLTTMRAQARGPIAKETMSRFYNPQQPHRFYCGVDHHARTMYVCILNQAGNIVFHQDLAAEPTL